MQIRKAPNKPTVVIKNLPDDYDATGEIRQYCDALPGFWGDTPCPQSNPRRLYLDFRTEAQAGSAARRLRAWL
jgi:hypothetical protein